MKTSARVLALLTAVLLAIGCLAACHGKDAVVATCTANDKTYTLTAGQYAFALIAADSEARTKVGENLTDAEKNAGTEIDYFSKSIDDKDYVTWVEERAEEILREYFYITSEFDRAGLELSESDATSKDSYFSYLWSMNGYQYICEPNGASFDSFTAVESVLSYQRNTLFNHIYGAEGTDPVSEEDKTAALLEHFAVADVITLDPSTLKETPAEGEETPEQTDEEKEAETAALKEQARAQLQGYADRINNGVSFSVIYYEFNGTQPSEEEEEEDPADHKHPQDTLATVYGDEDTTVSNALFAKVKACEVGKATVVETDDGKLALVLRQEITDDPYYADDLADEILSLLKGDEFDEQIKAGGKKLDVQINDYERDHIKVKNIDYSAYNEYMNALYSQYGQ